MVNKVNAPVIRTTPSLKDSVSVTLDDVKEHVKLLKAAANKDGLKEVLKNQKDMKMLKRVWTAATPAAAISAAVASASGSSIKDQPKTRDDLRQYADGKVLDGPPDYKDLSLFMADKPFARIRYKLPSGTIRDLLLRNVAYDAKSGNTRGSAEAVPLLASEDGMKFEPLMCGGTDGKSAQIKLLSEWDREADALRKSLAMPVGGSVTISVTPGKSGHSIAHPVKPLPQKVAGPGHHETYKFEYVPDLGDLFNLMEQREYANIQFRDEVDGQATLRKCLLRKSAGVEDKHSPAPGSTISALASETDIGTPVRLTENCQSELRAISQLQDS